MIRFPFSLKISIFSLPFIALAQPRLLGKTVPQFDAPVPLRCTSAPFSP